MLVLIVRGLWKGEKGILSNYARSLWWKLKQLFKLTFSYWDDDLVRHMHVQVRAQKWDENPFDDDEYHGDMLALIGTSHTLVWQFFSSTVVLSKFAETMNNFPLFIRTKEEELSMDPLFVKGDYFQTSKNVGTFLFDLAMFLRELFLEGRLLNALYQIFKFVITLYAIFKPSALLFVYFMVVALPFNLVKSLDALQRIGMHPKLLLRFLSQLYASITGVLCCQQGVSGEGKPEVSIEMGEDSGSFTDVEGTGIDGDDQEFAMEVRESMAKSARNLRQMLSESMDLDLDMDMDLNMEGSLRVHESKVVEDSDLGMDDISPGHTISRREETI
jgi:hypothetical protein